MTRTIIIPFLLLSLSGKINMPPAPKGCAIIISVPMVDNDMLHRKKLLADTLVFSNLSGAVKDNDKIYQILKQQGFKDENIIRLGTAADQKITIELIKGAFSAISKKVADDDLFVLYYSGHGHQVPNLPRSDRETDGKDEVLVTWNGYFLDDTINAIYKRSFSKTRNVMIVDACHAGTQYGITKKQIKSSQKDIAFLAGPWDCNITTETNVDENMNMLYFGASKDENEGWGTKEGGYFTRAMNSLHNMYWKGSSPQELACKISNKMKVMGDPGKGLIQYAELGQLNTTFKKGYLFKIK